VTDQSDNSFVTSLRIHGRVLSALYLREIMTRYGRDNLGFLWLFVEPMLYTLGVTGIWYLKGGENTQTTGVIPFAMTGYSTVILWRNTTNRSTTAISPNVGLLFHRNVQVWDVIVARILLELSGASVSFVLLCLFWMFMGKLSFPHDILLTIIAWGMFVWFSAGLALVIGSLAIYSDVVERIWHPLAYFMLPISGAFYLVEWLPTRVKEILAWFPLVDACEMLRDSFFGPTIHAYYDVAYLVYWNTGLSLAGLFFLWEAGHRVQVH